MTKELNVIAQAGGGGINKDEVYTLAEFKQRMGVGDHALRQMRRAGLPVLRLGRRKYVLGSDWITYVDACGQMDQPTPQ